VTRVATAFDNPFGFHLTVAAGTDSGTIIMPEIVLD
jgi:hypothetical protein